MQKEPESGQGAIGDGPCANSLLLGLTGAGSGLCPKKAQRLQIGLNPGWGPVV